MSSLLEVSGIVFWEKPADKEEILETLVRAACGSDRPAEAAAFLQAVRDREAEGSTFFNEGMAFPHARVAGLDRPLLALGAHALQNRQMDQLLRLARTAEEVHAGIREWEQLSRLQEKDSSSL